MTIGDRIREKRKNKDYTLEQLAEEIGVTKSTVLKYENGSIAIPSDKIEKIAKSLNVSPGYLMGWEEEKKQETQDDIITTYNLTPDELLEYEKIKSVNRALFFNDNRGSDEDKEELDEVLKKIFVKSLLNKRNKEK